MPTQIGSTLLLPESFRMTIGMFVIGSIINPRIFIYTTISSLQHNGGSGPAPAGRRDNSLSAHALRLLRTRLQRRCPSAPRHRATHEINWPPRNIDSGPRIPIAGGRLRCRLHPHNHRKPTGADPQRPDTPRHTLRRTLRGTPHSHLEPKSVRSPFANADR